MIRVACEACGAAFQAKDEHAGRRGKCPRCGEAIVVPELEAEDEDLDEDLDEDRDEDDDEDLDEDQPVVAAPTRRGRRRRPASRHGSRATSGRHAIVAGARLSGARRRSSRGNPAVVIIVVVVVVAAMGWGVMQFMGKLGIEGHYGVAGDLATVGRYAEAIAMLEQIPADDPMYAKAQAEIAELRATIDVEAQGKSRRDAERLFLPVMALKAKHVDRIDPREPEYAATVRFLLVRGQEFLDAHGDTEGAAEIAALMTQYADVASLSAPLTELDTSVEVRFRVFGLRFDKAWNTIAAFANQPGDSSEFVGKLRRDVRNAALEEWARVFSGLQASALREGSENWGTVRQRTRRYLDSVKGVPDVDSEARTWHDRAVRAQEG